MTPSRSVSVILLFLVIASTLAVTPIDAQNEQTSFTVIIDQAHRQYFNLTLLSTALSSLNDSSMGVTVYLKIIDTGGFTLSNLQGADLVMIPNPGHYSSPDDAYNLTEAYALQEYYNHGGNVFILSNPACSHENITGNPEALNNLLTLSGITTSRFGEGVGGGSTTIVDDYDVTYFDTNSSYRLFTGDLLNTSHPIIKEPRTVSTVFGYTENVIANDMHIVGKSSYSAYVVNTENVADKYQEHPAWLIAGEDIKPANVNETRGRIVLSGSTIMFSELIAETGNKFIEEGDNRQLFKNIVFWLLGVTPLESLYDPVDTPYSLFAWVVIGIAAVPTALFLGYLLKTRPEIVQKAPPPIRTQKTTGKRRKLRMRWKRK